MGTKEKAQSYNQKRGLLFALILLLLPVLPACGLGTKPGNEVQMPTATKEPDTGFVLTGPESFDSADTAIVMEKNTTDGTVTFWNLHVGRSYTLSYDGTTRFSDKYGESLSLEQVAPGDIVEVTFLKSKKHLTALQQSPKIWNLEKVTFFEIDTVRGEATVGQDAQKLKITENTKYFSDGRRIDPEELNPVDTLTFQGIDSEVLVVKIERGHGYLRLSGDEKFIGGWLEVGQSQIQRITEGMLLPVAEGTYSILVSKDGSSGEKTAIIHRNEETVVDIGDIEVAEPEVGTLLFSLTPSNAKLYVDGEKTDASLPVSLVYGIHQLIVRADGYQTLTQYVRVGQPSAGLDITLDPVSTSKDEEKESESSAVDTATDYYKVYIDAPESAEVYLDGSYVGVVPCSFPKKEGSHVVTLRKSGCSPKSYTLQINDEPKDISYSFAELELFNSQPGSGTGDLNSIVSDMLGTLLN